MHEAAAEMHSSQRSGSSTAWAIHDRERKYGAQRSLSTDDHPPSASLPRSGVSSEKASAALRKESAAVPPPVNPSTAHRQPRRAGDVNAVGNHWQISCAA